MVYIPGTNRASRRTGVIGPAEVLFALEGLVWDDGPEGIYVVLSFDPGGTTGWSVFGVHDVVMGPPPFPRWLEGIERERGGEVEGEKFSLEEARLEWKAQIAAADRYRILDNVAFWSAGEFGGYEYDQVDKMLGLVEAWPGTAPVVVEGFILRTYRQDSALLSPVRIRSAFGYGLRSTGAGALRGAGAGRQFITQQPALALGMASDERLRVWGGGAFYNQTAGQPHARDAVRHSLTFLRREKAARSGGKSLEIPVNYRAE